MMLPYIKPHFKCDWFSPGKASVLVGGQFGSEAKGLAAAWMTHAFLGSRPTGRIICTTNAGAQAGHTTQYADGTKFVCYHFPTTLVVGRMMGHDNMHGFLNGGSIISIPLLEKEIRGLPSGISYSVIIHRGAAVISESDVEREKTAGPNKIASTGKGVGSALASKILRSPDFKNIGQSDQNLDSMWITTVDARAYPLNKFLTRNQFPDSVVVEVPQGTHLSINQSGFYPHTTSRDCWVGSGLNDAGIHPSLVGEVCMVVRTFPIRVGNTVDEGGNINSSGPFFHDSTELSWDSFGPDIVPERTTVTNRVRRIATWSWTQYEHALTLNRPTIVFLTFVNYLKSVSEFCKMTKRMYEMERELGMPDIKHVYSWGPNVEDCGSFVEAAMWLDSKRNK